MTWDYILFVTPRMALVIAVMFIAWRIANAD